MTRFLDFLLAAIIVACVMIVVSALTGCGGGGGGYTLPYANTQQQTLPGSKGCRVVLSKADGGTGACIPVEE